jgi:tetratricopeptide (TPR) repeat protein
MNVLPLNRFLLLNVSLSFLITQATPLAYNPELVVVLMVKNEESVIIPTIKPFYDAGITAFEIFDTGSTDKTIIHVQDFFAKHLDIAGYIDEEPFVNFEVSRNRAMELAKHNFPDAGFFIIIDAEYYGEGLEALTTFCRQELQKPFTDQSPTAYYVSLHAGDMVLDQVRLVRKESKDKWVGKVHEVIIAERLAFVPRTVQFYFKPEKAGREKSLARWHWDKAILLEEHHKNPTDSRTLFYLAQTYECLGDNHNAIRYYLLRAQAGTNTEEDFICLYRLGILYGEIGCFHESVDYFLHAYAMRPTRAEPLVRLAQHYWKQKNYPLSYLYAYQATKLPFPTHDVLFIEKEIYEWIRYDVLSCAAFYVNDIKRGYKAARKALVKGPQNSEALKTNVLCYEHALKNRS